MTDILPELEPDDETEEESEDLLEDEYELYVEIATRMLYQVKFFENFVIVRAASPLFYRDIRKMSILDFSRYFEEFYGDAQQVRDFFNGLTNSEIEVFHDRD